MKTGNLTLPWLFFAVLVSAFSVLADIQYAGVNLSGAEFGQASLPGTFGTDYTWPTRAEITYFQGRGMNFIRLPFRWERLQHTNSAALDSTELGRMNAFVTNATAQGMYVLLDPHNFQRYYPSPRSQSETATTGLVGSSVPDADFSNFWSQVASVYKTNDHVFFGLNNEPDSLPETQLVISENIAIAAIRAAGATNLIFVPGNRYTGAWVWNQADSYGAANATAMLGIVDSGSNYVFEAHQYLDYDGSGSHTNIGPTATTADANIGWERLTNFTAWARANHVRGFLGEFAVADSMIGPAVWQIGDEALTNMLGYIQNNSDVWLGWAWWGGGPWWGNYLFALDPANIGLPNQTDQPAMAVLRNFIPIPAPILAFQWTNQFFFQTRPGFVYQPQISTNLLGGFWANFGPATTGASGLTMTNTMQSGNPLGGFYRIVVNRTP